MIIGITGMNGAGKGTIVDFLKDKGFKHYSVRSFLEDRLKSEELECNRDNMISLANSLRKEYCPSYIIEELYSLAEKESNAIIESIRCVGELEYLKNKGAYIFAVDADVEIRYSRVHKRGLSTDGISFEDFVRQENLEKSNEDKFKQNLSKCISLSDYIFNNDKSIEDLNNYVEMVLKEIN